MKVVLFCLVLMLAANSAFSQPTTTAAKPLTKADYLKKSKNQKLAAFLFLAGGGTLIVLGSRDGADDLGNSEDTRSTAAVVAGIASLGVSTTLFIASARNKKKSDMMAIKMEKAPMIQQGSMVYSNYPALALRIKL